MSNHLFLFTISPVQSFISQARKTQDLYSGSQLLSHLIEIAIDKLEKIDSISEVEIIFPFKDTPSKPNRFIAKIITENPQGVGEILEKAIQEKFKQLCNDRFKDKPGFTSIQKSFNNQIENFLEIFWLAIPFEENYFSTFEKIEKYLGGVKNIRAFKQLPEKGRKCSLCGERNVLFYKDRNSDDRKRNIDSYVSVDKKDYRFLTGEGLCAICATKRYYDTKIESFPSTARIGLLHALHEIKKKPEGYVLIENYKKIFGSQFDEQLYHKENLNKKYFEKHDLKESISKLKTIQTQQNLIANYASKYNIHLAKYYAVVTFDGDSMGEWLSGEKIKNNLVNLESFHRLISQKLGDFSKFAINILKAPNYKDIAIIKNEYFGKTTYAGGDDYLGFVNLNYLFQVLLSLKTKFNDMVNQTIKNEFELNNPEDNFTFSAGIALAHYKTPLSIALEWARNMQKLAKKVEGKDAVGFALLKHSGNIAQSVLKWNYHELKVETMVLAINLTTALKNHLSNKFLYTLREEFLHLIDPKTKIKGLYKEIQSELFRLMNRHIKKKNTNGALNVAVSTNDPDLDVLAKQLSDLIVEIDKMSLESLDAFNNFISFLEICNFISRET
ncbi:MAG: type III-B CRISPR-associated protein Cas10/Cmr2 [Candidatus Lokiarchaeota archaeon]|nr:type III-B CRISPR-associated protein Cas10/Cmr2 [Candidatus Lokiarchaeota archaeon]